MSDTCQFLTRSVVHSHLFLRFWRCAYVEHLSEHQDQIRGALSTLCGKVETFWRPNSFVACLLPLEGVAWGTEHFFGASSNVGERVKMPFTFNIKAAQWLVRTNHCTFPKKFLLRPSSRSLLLLLLPKSASSSPLRRPLLRCLLFTSSSCSPVKVSEFSSFFDLYYCCFFYVYLLVCFLSICLVFYFIEIPNPYGFFFKNCFKLVWLFFFTEILIWIDNMYEFF